MKNITFFAAFSTLAIAMYHAPMTTMIIAIATLVALDLIGRYCSHRQKQVVDRSAAYDEIKALFQQADEIMSKPIYQEEDEQVEDAWDTEVTSCELACPVNFPVQPVMALPAVTPAHEVKEMVLVDYSEFSYKELQAKCKALRPNAKAIKLNSKKAVLVAWLKANA